MVAIALLSAKGSPGVTTCALALSTVWPQVHPDRRVLLVEGDPAGGDIASGYLRGTLDGSRGLPALAAQRSFDSVAAVWEQVLALDSAGQRFLLPGLTDPRQAVGVGAAWATLAAALEGLQDQDPPIDVLMDLGRMRTTYEDVALRRRADLIVLVTGSSLPAVVAARAAATELSGAVANQQNAQVGCLVVGDSQPYSAAEISSAIGIPVLGVLPHDPRSASVFSCGDPTRRRFAQAPLLRATHSLATGLFDQAHPAHLAPVSTLGVNGG